MPIIPTAFDKMAAYLVQYGVNLDDESVLRQLKQQWVENPRFEFHRDLLGTTEDCYRRLLLPTTESSAERFGTTAIRRSRNLIPAASHCALTV